MGRAEITRSGVSDVNYLDDRLLASYFEAREHEAYYRSLHHANARRDFHGTIIPVLIDLVGEVLSARNPQLLDAIVARASAIQHWSQREMDATEEAKALHPSGFDILRIVPPLDSKSLKTAYHRASFRCHPDHRGSHEDMVLVNEAFELFEQMLYRRQIAPLLMGSAEAPSIEFDIPIRTAKDYMYVIGMLLLDIKLDEWGLDDAHYWVTMLISDEWLESDYARHPRTRSNLLFPCSTLAGRLWGAGMKEQAQEVYGIAEAALKVAIENDLYYGSGLFEADKYIKQGQKLRVVLNHPRQAENALRLEIIDERRYRQVVGRLEEKKEQTDDQGEVLRRYVTEVGFIQGLPPDCVAEGKVVQARLVPKPDYFNEKVQNLTDDQQAEYLLAYGRAADLGLVKKYVYVRLVSLMRTMILHHEEADFRAIERECRLLSPSQTQNAAWCCDHVADLARYLGELEPRELAQRCEILRFLDERAVDPMDGSRTYEREYVWIPPEDRQIGFDSTSEGNPSAAFALRPRPESAEVESVDSVFRVRPDPRYFEIVRLPLDRLELARRTGSTKTKQEEAEERGLGS